MRRLSRAYLETIAARVNRAYWRLPESTAVPHRVDPTILLTVLLRLKLDARHLSSDGLTSFFEADNVSYSAARFPGEHGSFRLEPKYKEPYAWFRENTGKEGPFGTEKQTHVLFDQCCLCHYGDMKFKNPEILELTEVL